MTRERRKSPAEMLCLSPAASAQLVAADQTLWIDAWMLSIKGIQNGKLYTNAGGRNEDRIEHKMGNYAPLPGTKMSTQ